MFSASKLKEHRLAKKLSQTAIANELGVTRATLSAWETGKTVPILGTSSSPPYQSQQFTRRTPTPYPLQTAQQTQ